MSSSPPPPQPKTYAEMMRPVPGAGKEHYADALSKIEPEHLHARSRIPAIFAMATHSTLSKYLRKDKNFTNINKVTFDMSTLSGLMDCWQFEYEAIAISLDGKGRHETENVLKLAAIGGQDETGVLASSVLNEGNKTLGGKATKTS